MGLPRLVLLALVFVVVWSAVRWFARPRPELPRRRTAARRALSAQDLTACRVCGAYVADGSRGCGRSDCPRPH
jgi:hypothetical protein